MPIRTLYVALVKKASSAGGNSTSTFGDKVSLVSDFLIFTLTVAVPCAITSCDSLLTHEKTVGFSMEVLSKGSKFVGAFVTITSWLVERRSFFAKLSACKASAASFSAISGSVARFPAYWTVLVGRTVLLSTSWRSNGAVVLAICSICMVYRVDPFMTGASAGFYDLLLDLLWFCNGPGRKDRTF